MLIVLKKEFTFSVTIREDNDEFWDSIRAKGTTGADELLQTVKDALAGHGFDVPSCHVRLTQYREIA